MGLICSAIFIVLKFDKCPRKLLGASLELRLESSACAQASLLFLLPFFFSRWFLAALFKQHLAEDLMALDQVLLRLVVMSSNMATTR